MQNARHQLGRRLGFGNAPDKRRHALNVGGEFGARGALREVGFKRSPLLTAERSVHVVAQQDFELCARHILIFCLRSTRASSERPRFNRDFTVPSGTFKICAISRYSNSSRSLRITVSRSSGESFCNAACSNSLASRPASMPSVLAIAAVFSSSAEV